MVDKLKNVDLGSQESLSKAKTVLNSMSKLNDDYTLSKVYSKGGLKPKTNTILPLDIQTHSLNDYSNARNRPSVMRNTADSFNTTKTLKPIKSTGQIGDSLFPM